MLSSFFLKNDSDLDGYHFKKRFETSAHKLLLDVRTATEFNSGSIPSAINIDFMAPEFRSLIENLDKAKTYFVYCRSGTRSAQAVSTMKKLGLNAFNLLGGINAWPKT